MLIIKIPTRLAEYRRILYRVKLAILQPYWLQRLRSERFNALHALNMPQSPRKTWEIFVPWHTRGDMRKRLAKPVTFSTAKSPQAFADARILNIQRASNQQRPQGPPPSLRYQGGPYYPPPPPYCYYPNYWGPSFGFYYGGGFRGYGWRR